MNLPHQIVVKKNERESSFAYRLLKTWAEIDLPALRHNISLLRNRIGENTGIMAVVKCNAYGH